MQVRLVTNIEWSGGEISSFAILEDGRLEDTSIVVVPTLYLLNLAKLGKQPNSIRAAAEDLKTYWQALSEAKIEWSEISDSQMTEYLVRVLQKRNDLTDRSIERHKSTIRGCYKFSEEHGLIEVSPEFTFNYVRNSQNREQGSGKGKANFQLKKKYISSKLIKVILSGIKSRDQFCRERDELALWLGYYCGLRTSETTHPRNLDTKYLRDKIAEAKSKGRLTISVDIFGKGNKYRNIEFRPEIVVKLENFLNGRRKSLPEGPLICTSKGKPLASSHATRTFKTALKIAEPHIEKHNRELRNSEDDEFLLPLASARLISISCPPPYLRNKLGKILLRKRA